MPRKATRWPLLALGLCAPASGFAQEAAKGGRDLQALVAEALERNPEVQAARARWEAAQFRIPQARALPDPHVASEFETTADLTRVLGIEYELSQTIPFPGKLGLRGRVARKEAEQAEAQYVAKRREIATQVKVAYYQLFLAHKLIEIKQDELDLFRTFSGIAQAKYVVGTAVQPDVLNAQTRLAASLNELVRLEQERVTAGAALNTLLNRAPDVPIQPPEPAEIPRLRYPAATGLLKLAAERPSGPPQPLELPPFPYTVEQLQQLALDQRPDLQAARAAIERGRAAHSLAKRQYFPDFVVGLEYDQHFTGTDVWAPSLGITMPWLWTKGKYDAQVRETRAQVQSSEAAYMAVRNRALFEIRDLLAKIRAAEEQARMYYAAVLPLAEQTLHSSAAAYQAGQVDFLTLVENQRTLRTVGEAYYRTLVAYYQRLAELELAVGAELE